MVSAEGSSLRLVKLELKTEYVLKTLEKLKQSDSGTLSQLLPATLKLTLVSTKELDSPIHQFRTVCTRHSVHLLAYLSQGDKRLEIHRVDLANDTVFKHVASITYEQPVHKIDVAQQYPFYITVVDHQKQVVFFSVQIWFLTKSGSHLAKFDLARFVLGEKATMALDLQRLEVGCFNLGANIFVILLDQYVIGAVLSFEEQQQAFQLNLMTKHQDLNDIYFGKFYNTRYAKGDKFYKLPNGRFLLKQEDRFISFEDYFETSAFKKLDEQTTVLSNFHFQTFSTRSRQRMTQRT